MDTIPLVCSFEEGCVLTLVPVPVTATMDDVAAAMAEHFAGRMLMPRPDQALRVRAQGDGAFLPRDLRVCDTGWTPLTTVQVGYEPPGASPSRH